MLIIGIDPGISGAICFFQNGEITGVIDISLIFAIKSKLVDPVNPYSKEQP